MLMCLTKKENIVLCGINPLLQTEKFVTRLGNCLSVTSLGNSQLNVELSITSCDSSR